MASDQPSTQPASASGKGKQQSELIDHHFWSLDEVHDYPESLKDPTAAERPIGLPDQFSTTGMISLIAKARIYNNRGQQRFNHMQKQFTEAIAAAKKDYLAIKNEYVSLSTEEKATRKMEFQQRLEPVVQKLRDFENADANKWMFLNDPYRLLANPTGGHELNIKTTLIMAMRAGFQIAMLSVEGLDRKLSDEPYLKSKEGFFDFEEYVASVRTNFDKDKGGEFQKRKMPEYCVKVIDEANETENNQVTTEGAKV